MRAVIQRVESAEVRVAGTSVGGIGTGLLVLLGISADDTSADRDWLIKRLLGLRLFDDANGMMAMTVGEAGGALLVVSQFTLLASTRKGSKPSWHRAAPTETARRLYGEFVDTLRRETTASIATGTFGAEMRIALVNDGPLTLVIDSRLRE